MDCLRGLRWVVFLVLLLSTGLFRGFSDGSVDASEHQVGLELDIGKDGRTRTIFSGTTSASTSTSSSSGTSQVHESSSSRSTGTIHLDSSRQSTTRATVPIRRYSDSEAQTRSTGGLLADSSSGDLIDDRPFTEGVQESTTDDAGHKVSQEEEKEDLNFQRRKLTSIGEPPVVYTAFANVTDAYYDMNNGVFNEGFFTRSTPWQRFNFIDRGTGRFEHAVTCHYDPVQLYVYGVYSSDCGPRVRSVFRAWRKSTIPLVYVWVASTYNGKKVVVDNRCREKPLNCWAWTDGKRVFISWNPTRRRQMMENRLGGSKRFAVMPRKKQSLAYDLYGRRFTSVGTLYIPQEGWLCETRRFEQGTETVGTEMAPLYAMCSSECAGYAFVMNHEAECLGDETLHEYVSPDPGWLFPESPPTTQLASTIKVFYKPLTVEKPPERLGGEQAPESFTVPQSFIPSQCERLTYGVMETGDKWNPDKFLSEDVACSSPEGVVSECGRLDGVPYRTNKRDGFYRPGDSYFYRRTGEKLPMPYSLSSDIEVDVLYRYDDQDNWQEGNTKRYYISSAVLLVKQATLDDIRLLNASFYDTNEYAMHVSNAHERPSTHLVGRRNPVQANTGSDQEPFCFVQNGQIKRFSMSSVTDYVLGGSYEECLIWINGVNEFCVPTAADKNMKPCSSGEFFEGEYVRWNCVHGAEVNGMPHTVVKVGFLPATDEPLDNDTPRDWVVPIYFAYGFASQSAATIKLWGHDWAKIWYGEGVCPTRNSVRFKGICYSVDWSVRSMLVPISGYPDEYTASSGFIFHNYDFLRFKPKGNTFILGKVSQSSTLGYFSACGLTNLVGPYLGTHPFENKTYVDYVPNDDPSVVLPPGGDVVYVPITRPWLYPQPYTTECEDGFLAYEPHLVRYASPISLGAPSVSCTINSVSETIDCVGPSLRYSICWTNIQNPRDHRCAAAVASEFSVPKKHGYSYYIVGDPGSEHLTIQHEPLKHTLAPEVTELVYFDAVGFWLVVFFCSPGYIYLAVFLLGTILQLPVTVFQLCRSRRPTALGIRMRNDLIRSGGGCPRVDCPISRATPTQKKLHARAHWLKTYFPFFFIVWCGFSPLSLSQVETA